MKTAILCLNCQQFNRDIHELRNHAKRYRFILAPGLAAGQTWIPEHMREQSAYVNFTGPEVDALWERSRRYAVGVIEKIQSSVSEKIVAVMAGNWDYWEEECMRLACAELGLPFLVLLRESFLNTYGLQENIDYYSRWSRIPQPDALALAGERTVTLMENLNLFPKAPLVATGWPRLDVWRRPVEPMLDKPVVLMSYRKGYHADRHFLDMLTTFDNLAKRYPHIPFVVKAKHLLEAEKLVQVVKDRGLTVRIVDLMELPALLCNARAVIGFNSMIMLEALLSPAHLIVPYWGETEQDPGVMLPSPLDERLVEHMTFATSEKMLAEMVDWAISGKMPPVDMESRPKVFSEYFTYTQDRTCADRVEDFVDTVLRRAS